MRTLTIVAASLLCAAPALAQERFSETRPIDPSATVTVENVRGLIRVTGTERADVAISGVLGKGSTGLKIDGDRRRLTIRIEYPERSNGWFGGWGDGGGEASELIVELPGSVSLVTHSVAAEVDVRGMRGARVDIESVSGDVEYRGSAQQLELETVSGDIRAEGTAREASMQGVSGDLVLKATVSERLRTESVSGDLRIELAGEIAKVQASVVSGDIDLRLALAKGGRLSAESLSGDLEVHLPSSSSARVSASSFSGSIRSDAGKVKKEEFGPGSSLETVLGSGDGEIQLESFSGDLTLRLD